MRSVRTIDPENADITGEPQTLTENGRRWAERHVFDDIVAKVALRGAETGWPAGHVEVAIKQANENGTDPTTAGRR